MHRQHTRARVRSPSRAFWPIWGSDRPPDDVCLDELVIRNGFSSRGAPLFLASYDDTIAFAGLTTPGKIGADSVAADDGDDEPASSAGEEQAPANSPASRLVRRAPIPQKGVAIMEGERELTTGLLSKDASFRLIVNGTIGVREIERLIRKLELDKEILADEGDGDTANEQPGEGKQ